MLPLPCPDHRYQAVLRAVASATPPASSVVETALYELLVGSATALDDVRYLHSLRLTPFKREALEAFLLAGAPANTIEDVLGVSAGVVAQYESLYFDQSVFRDRLDVINYVETYPTSADNGFGKGLKQAALNLGLEYLKASYGKGRHNVSTKTAINELVTQSYLFTRAGSLHALDSIKAIQARQWAATMLKSIETLEGLSKEADDNKSDLRFVLRIENNTGPTPQQEVINPHDIVHRRESK